jgi:hypothetical protein
MYLDERAGDLAFPSGIGKIQRSVGMSGTSNCRREPTCYLHDGRPSHRDKFRWSEPWPCTSYSNRSEEPC